MEENQLKAAEFWCEDAAGVFEDIGDAAITNRDVPVSSKAVELQGRLHLDLAMQEKYLPNGIEMKIRLSRSSPRFCLMADECPSKIKKIDTAILTVSYVQFLPTIVNDLNQPIVQHNAKLPIRRVEVKTFTIGSGLGSKTEDHLFQGQLPKRLFICMISNEVFNGSFDTNPFFFQQFDLSKLETCDAQCLWQTI